MRSNNSGNGRLRHYGNRICCSSGSRGNCGARMKSNNSCSAMGRGMFRAAQELQQ
jgi:hypothetical protein